MQGQNLPKICTNVISFFSKTAERLGKTVKFVQRESKLTAKLFTNALVIGCLSNPNVCLEDMRRLLKQRGVKITKQGLHKRHNPQATELMKLLFEESLQQFKTEKHDVIDLLKPFNSIEILDSSGVSLPIGLKDLYAGFGGAASEAGLKIQVLFNYADAQIRDLAITDARKNDQSFKDHLNKIEKGSLYLQDLGYFDTESFNKIVNAGAYFISRYLSQTKIFYLNKEPMSLVKKLRKAKSSFAKEVLLGQKIKVKVRLIASRLPAAEMNERLRKMKKEAKKKGRTLTRETLELAKWSIFITNVPVGILNNKQVYLVYLLRWQIELFFKLCKSVVGIDKINGKKRHRVDLPRDFQTKLI